MITLTIHKIVNSCGISWNIGGYINEHGGISDTTYYGYTKKAAISKYRKENNLRYKRLEFIEW
ncbi:MAG: hypothetical protein Q4A15_02045 [Prevotellaceae bacterium]|nr:hypothetical protein [Prevotellaceae bacterium]